MAGVLFVRVWRVLRQALRLVWRQALQLREEGGGVGAGVRDGGPAVRLAA